MKLSLFFGICCLLLASVIEIVQPTCVLDSDFGFKINCAFKKSSLFRVRNLGGIKAHASLGFSLGDELGFDQSLTNLDPSRRRSVSIKNGVPPIEADQLKPVAKQEKRGKQNRIMMRPITPTYTRPNQAAMDKLASLHQKVASTMRPIVVGSTIETPATFNRPVPTVTLAKPLPMGVPVFKPLPPKDESLQVVPISATKKNYSPLQIPQSKGPGLAYQSEKYPQSHNQISKMVSQMTAVQFAQPHLIKITPTPLVAITPKYVYNVPNSVNQFIPRPIASPPTQGLTIIPAPAFKEIQTPHTKYSPPNTYHIQKTVNPVSNFVDPVPHQVHDLASKYGTFNTKKVDDYNSITGYGDDTILKFNKNDINTKIAEIAKAGNISMEAVEAAIVLRQQQLLSKYANLPVPTTTSTTTTEEPVIFQPQPEPQILVDSVHHKPQRPPSSGKVMNAPKEYYPIGYEKNFDDHFQSKVDLPDTNFHCGDQKYFPGLYGDESLGCMVFHVCALTDDGLVMKSFLCPESTLFDQTILKCNWWFYVDCKNTRKLYDTNIPVSKSYQLMKALTFFSSYKKEMQEDGHPKSPEVAEGIKEAISILENQNNANHRTNIGHSAVRATPQTIIDEINNGRNEYSSEASPVYRANRHLNNSTNRKNTQSYATITPITQDIVDSAYKFIAENADLNFNKHKNPISSEETDSSKEKKHKRRQTLRNSSYSAKSTTPEPTTKKPEEVTASSFDLVRQEIQPIDNYRAKVKQDKLTDQLENSYILNPASFINLGNLGEVKRFYRSSGERPSNSDDKEMTVVNNEKVQIVRPTSMAKLVGQYATTTAAIAKLDEAILGKRKGLRFKQADTIVTPQTRDLRSPMNNQT